VGNDARKASQTAAKAKDLCRAERRFAVNIRRYATGADQGFKKAVRDFTKRLKACVQAKGGHFEHLM